MSKQEYESKLKELEECFVSDKQALYSKYAFGNNPHKIGDIIKDHAGHGKIEQIKYAGPHLGMFPQCVYLCLELKVNLEPKKSGLKRQIWQSNIKP